MNAIVYLDQEIRDNLIAWHSLMALEMWRGKTLSQPPQETLPAVSASICCRHHLRLYMLITRVLASRSIVEATGAAGHTW